MHTRNPGHYYPKYKLALVGLLAVDVFFYAATDTLTSTLDALTWLLLLIMFELETLHLPVLPSAKQIRMIRNLLIVIIGGVFLSYVESKEWLDVINAVLWFILIALLELEIRRQPLVAQYRALHKTATLTVFGGLIGMVFAWAWQSAWLDAYDAVLWIAAFGAIEVDIIQFLSLNPEQPPTH